MKEQMNVLEEKMKSLVGNKKALAGVGILIVIVFAIIVTTILNAGSDYMVLYQSNDPNEINRLYSSLKLSGADPKLGEDGQILVLEEEYDVWAFQVASEGYAVLTYDLMIENSGMTQTESERQQWILYQTQDRIQAMLKRMDGIVDAVVGLNIKESTNYIWEQVNNNAEGSAAVLLTLANDVELSASQVTSIKNFVAAQIQDLNPENVTLTNAKTMTDMVGEVTETNHITTQQNFDFERTVQKQIEDNIVRLLTPRYGKDGVVATAKVTINYDDMITEQYELFERPDGDGFITDKTVQGSVVGSEYIGGIVGEEDNTDIPTYPYGGIDGDDTTYFRTDTKFDYSYIKTQIEKGQASIERATVSVMVADDNFTDARRDDLIGSISASVDIPGELIFVSTYEQPDVETIIPIDPEEPETILGSIPVIVWIALGGILLLIIIISIIVRKLKKKKQEKLAAQAAKEANTLEEMRLQSEQEIEDYKRQLMENAQSNNDAKGDAIAGEISDFAKQNPEVTASLIRSWLREDGE